MSRVIAVAAGVTLAACSSMSLDIVGSTPPVATVQLESEPPGAEAKTSLGPACKTPCSVDVPTASDFTVTFALAGYQPQTVPVRLQAPVDRVDDEVGAVPIVILDPNPVYAELQRATPAARRAARKQQAAPRPEPPPEPAAGSSPWPQIR